MKIGINNYQSNAISQYQNKQTQASKDIATEVKAERRDTLEISSEAYSKLKDNNAEMRATSGKDLLSVSKGKDENTFVVDFEHLANVSRAVSRGYITVNGVDIELSDETKTKMMDVAKAADEKSEAAFMSMIAKYNIDIAEQQAEVWKHAFDTPDSIRILFGLDKEDVTNRTEERNSTPDPKDYEWKTYNPTMEVTIKNGEVSIGDIKVEEVTIQEGR